MLTAKEMLHFANEYSPEQIEEFAARILASTTQAERTAILREFNANLPGEGENNHPQSLALLNACQP